MDIRIDKNVVEFTPGNPAETKQLEELWRVIVDCARFSRRLVPIGEYIPGQRNMARFAIEGDASRTIRFRKNTRKTRGVMYVSPAISI